MGIVPSALGGLVFLIAAAGDPAADVDYFPPGSLNPHKFNEEFKRKWYAGDLRKFGETPLGIAPPRDATVYRLMILPSFSERMMVRVERSATGSPTLTWKEIEAENETRHKTQKETRNLTEDEWKSIQDLVDAAF